MLTVACVLRSGGRYSAEWVRKLRDGVARHMSAEHRFVCLSDVSVPCERIELTESMPGWWSKMELFKPGQFDGPVLFLDLDSLIVGDVAPLARTSPGFTMVSDFYSPRLGNSCVLSWVGDYSAIWSAFIADPAQIMDDRDRMPGARVGDQSFIHDTLGAFDTFDPAQVVSFKKDAQRGPGPDARVVCFHGDPKPDAPSARWAHEAWSAL